MTKRHMFDLLLAEDYIFIQLDATREGVVVPDYLRATTLVLAVAYNFARPIVDLVVDDWGISGGFSFSGAGIQNCRIPWSAVYSMRRHGDDMTCVWPITLSAESASEPEPDPSPAPTGRHLKAV